MSLIAERISKKALRPLAGAPQMRYQMIGGSLVPITDNSANYITKGYKINDIIYSIMELILDKVRLAPWSMYEVVDESSLKSVHAILSKKDISAEDLRMANALKTKAFKPVKNAGKWGDLLKEPNEQYGFSDFVGYGCGYKMLTGNKFIWANILEGGANKGFPQELWVMPSHWMQIVASMGFPAKVTGYNMPTVGATGIRGFKKEEVLHEKYDNYDFSASGSQLWGAAPLQAGLKLTNRNNSALDTSTAKFQNGGLEAIIYNDDPDLDKELGLIQLNALKDSLINEYTGPINQGKIATSGYKIGVEKLGLSPVELNIIEAEKWDLRRFCNLFRGVPSQLLNDPENKTYNNQREGEKALTSRCAITLLSDFRNTLNRHGHRNWNMPKNWIADYDTTVYSELSQDMGELIEWLKPLAEITGISPNRVLELMGLEKINDKLFDENWIREGMGTPQSEWSLRNADKILNDEEEV